MWEEARLCEEKGKRRRCARRCSGHRRRQEKDEAAILVKCEHPGRAVAADAARRERFDRMAASDSAAAACHLWSAFDSMTWRKDPLDGLKLYSGDEHYWSSVGFTAAPVFAAAGIWFVVFGVAHRCPTLVIAVAMASSRLSGGPRL
ncbi:Os04g0647550 [Oryza sativa Japonica Group]|uniref:Os04g0647550 protein n=1 Tax=Oryza sativa subsp. japonica TaxID=39947 RepID=A0A0N7KJT6_ORYSJ|nr:Os04g0647550 [Oryza sativa Japonica Group]